MQGLLSLRECVLPDSLERLPEVSVTSCPLKRHLCLGEQAALRFRAGAV
jgi:hypothetical protein